MNKPEPFTEKLFRAIGAPMNPLCYETADQIYTVVWRAYFLGYSDAKARQHGENPIINVIND